MNNIGCVSDEWFNEVKNESIQLINEFDPRCIESINVIRKLDNIATKWSCSGHYHGENDRPASQASITFVVKDSPEQLIEGYQKWVDKLTQEEWLFLRPRLSMNKLLYLDPKMDNDKYWSWRVVLGKTHPSSLRYCQLIEKYLLNLCNTIADH